MAKRVQLYGHVSKRENVHVFIRTLDIEVKGRKGVKEDMEDAVLLI